MSSWLTVRMCSQWSSPGSVGTWGDLYHGSMEGCTHRTSAADEDRLCVCVWQSGRCSLATVCTSQHVRSRSRSVCGARGARSAVCCARWARVGRPRRASVRVTCACVSLRARPLVAHTREGKTFPCFSASATRARGAQRAAPAAAGDAAEEIPGSNSNCTIWLSCW